MRVEPRDGRDGYSSARDELLGIVVEREGFLFRLLLMETRFILATKLWASWNNFVVIAWRPLSVSRGRRLSGSLVLLQYCCCREKCTLHQINQWKDKTVNAYRLALIGLDPNIVMYVGKYKAMPWELGELSVHSMFPGLASKLPMLVNNVIGQSGNNECMIRSNDRIFWSSKRTMNKMESVIIKNKRLTCVLSMLILFLKLILDINYSLL